MLLSNYAQPVVPRDWMSGLPEAKRQTARWIFDSLVTDYGYPSDRIVVLPAGVAYMDLGIVNAAGRPFIAVRISSSREETWLDEAEQCFAANEDVAVVCVAT